MKKPIRSQSDHKLRKPGLFQVYVTPGWTAMTNGMPSIGWPKMSCNSPRLECDAEELAQILEYERGFCAWVEPQ